MKILIIEDNPVLRDRIGRQFLKREVIDFAETGEKGLKLANNDYSVIILDLGLPDISGFDVCDRIRDKGIETPILVLTADNDVASRVTLLNAGADDYLSKPFHSEELVARVNALTRRKPHKITDQNLDVGELRINRDRRVVERSGVIIYLTRKEFDILEYLAQNKGRVVTRAIIRERVWPSDGGSIHNVVDVHIKRLRDKIDRPFAEPLIHTAHGLGYVLDTTP